MKNIAVILISKNNFEFINYSIESIIKQQNVNIDLFVIDDVEAIDYDVKNIEEYILKIKNENIQFKVIKRDNKKNVASCTNEILESYKGKAFTILYDNEYYLDSNTLATMSEMLDLDIKAKMIFTQVKVFDYSNNNYLYDYIKEADLEILRDNYDEWLKNEVIVREVISSSGNLYSMDVFDNIKDKIGYELTVRYPMQIRFLLRDNKARFLPNINMAIRKTNEYRSVNNQVKFYNEIYNIYEKEIAPNSFLYNSSTFDRATKRFFVNRRNTNRIIAEDEIMNLPEGKVVFGKNINHIKDMVYMTFYQNVNIETITNEIIVTLMLFLTLYYTNLKGISTWTKSIIFVALLFSIILITFKLLIKFAKIAIRVLKKTKNVMRSRKK